MAATLELKYFNTFWLKKLKNVVGNTPSAPTVPYNNKIHFDIKDHLNFCTRTTGAMTRNANQQLNLPIPKTKTTTAAHFYPTRLARIWNSLPVALRETIKTLSSNLVIKQHLIPLFKNELATTFDSENTCTWIHFCQCTRCKTM